MILHHDKNGYKYFLDFEGINKRGSKLNIRVRAYIADIFEILEQNKEHIDTNFTARANPDALLLGSEPYGFELDDDVTETTDYESVVNWLKTSGLLKNQKCSHLPGRFLLRSTRMKSYTFEIKYNIKTGESTVESLENGALSYIKFQEPVMDISPMLIKKAVLSSELEFELVTMLLADEL